MKPFITNGVIYETTKARSPHLPRSGTCGAQWYMGRYMACHHGAVRPTNSNDEVREKVCEMLAGRRRGIWRGGRQVSAEREGERRGKGGLGILPFSCKMSSGGFISLENNKECRATFSHPGDPASPDGLRMRSWLHRGEG